MSPPAILFAEVNQSAALSPLAEAVLVALFSAAVIAFYAGKWAVYQKAEMGGWPSIVPVYEFVVMLRIIDRPVWWTIWLIIGCTSFPVWFVVCIDLARSFNKSTAFGLGLFFLPFIFFPLLGFSKAQYLGRPLA